MRASFIGSNCLLDQKGLLKTRNTGYGSLHAPPLLAAHEPTHRHKKIQTTGGSGTFFPTPPFSTGGDLKKHPNTQQSVCFNFLSLFTDLFFFFLFLKSTSFGFLSWFVVLSLSFQWQIYCGEANARRREVVLLWGRRRWCMVGGRR